MRILSQDIPMINIFDIPYETAMLSMSKYTEGRYRIYSQGTFVGNTSDDNFVLMAEYSTEEKARKAMEMLHEAYTDIPLILQNVDISDDVKEMFKKWKKQGICVVSENQPSKVEYVGNVLFQFPTDDEVEV